MKRLALAAAILLGLARPALAAPTKEQCVDAYKANQKLRRDGALRAAREQLLVCAADPCPPVLQADCIPWLKEVDELMPSVVVHAQIGGVDTADVRVVVDGVELTRKLDGRPLDVDPGEHTFVFEHPGSPAVEQRVLVVERQKARLLEVVLPEVARPAAATRPAATTRPVPALSIVLGGAAVGALAAGAVFGTIGLVERGDLGACKPTCAAHDIDVTRRKFLVADIAFAAGALAASAALVLWFVRPNVNVAVAPTGASFSAAF